MALYRNKIIACEGRAYEVFWTSQNARHVCLNLYAGDALHDLDHEAIVRVLEAYEKVAELTKDRYVFLSRHHGRVYEIHVLFRKRNSQTARPLHHHNVLPVE